MVRFWRSCVATAALVQGFVRAVELPNGSFFTDESHFETVASDFNRDAKNGNLDGIRSLMEKIKTNADKQLLQERGDHWQKTALHYAAESGHADTIKYLSKSHSNTLAVDYRGRTALHLAASKGNIDAVRQLTSINNDLLFVLDNENRNALHFAAETGQYQVVKYLVSTKTDKTKLDVNSATGTFKTALMIASERGHIDFISVIMQDKYGVDFSMRTHPGGVSAMMMAAKIGHLPIISMVSRRNKEGEFFNIMRQEDAQGRNIFHYAAMSGQSGLVDWLYKFVARPVAAKATAENADVTAAVAETMKDYLKADANKVTPLHVGSKFGHQNICQYFVSLKVANWMIEATDKYGQTPLHLAARLPATGFTEILEYHTPLPLGKFSCIDSLLKFVHNGSGGDAAAKYVNKQDLLFHTALSRAVEYGCSTTINRLFKSGGEAAKSTKIQQKPMRNMNLIHYAIYKNQLNVIDTLVKHGVRRDETMSDGSTPLTLAIKQNNFLAVEKMLHYNNKNSEDTQKNVINKIDQNKKPRTPLIWAVLSGNIDIVKVIIANGGDVNFAADNLGLTPLHFAAAKGDNEIVSTLIRAGAKYDALDKNKISPLDTAIYYDKFTVVEALLLKYQNDYMVGSDPVDKNSALGQMYEKARTFALEHLPADNKIVKILTDHFAQTLEQVHSMLEEMDLYDAGDYSEGSDYYAYYYNVEDNDISNFSIYDNYAGLQMVRKRRSVGADGHKVKKNLKRKRRSARNH